MSRQPLYSLILLFLVLFGMISCGTQKPSGTLLYNPKEVAMLSDKLGISLNNLNKDDDQNMALYAETSLWLGVPYRSGGLSRKGVDCSGFTYLIYQKVYKMKLPRSTSDLSDMKLPRVSKHNLKTGDLVFFATSRKHNRVNHVGIYLKNNCFIHASTSRGVIVSSLDENYYKQTWKRGGRLRTLK